MLVKFFIHILLNEADTLSGPVLTTKQPSFLDRHQIQRCGVLFSLLPDAVITAGVLESPQYKGYSAHVRRFPVISLSSTLIVDTGQALHSQE